MGLTPNLDLGPAECFCVMDFKGQKFATGQKQTPSNVTWNEGAEWDLKLPKDRKQDVVLTVKQKKNKKVKDGFLGQCALDISQFLQDWNENEPAQKQTFPLRNKKNESDSERGYLIFKLQFKNLNMADLEGGMEGKKSKSLLSLGKSKDKNEDPFERGSKRRGSMFDLSRKKKDKDGDLERGSKKRSSMFDRTKEKMFGSKSNISKEDKKTRFQEQRVDVPGVNTFDERNLPSRLSKRKEKSISSNPFDASSNSGVNQFDDRNLPARISKRKEKRVSETSGINSFDGRNVPERLSNRHTKPQNFADNSSTADIPGVNAFDERNMPMRISKRKSVTRETPDNNSSLFKAQNIIDRHSNSTTEINQFDARNMPERISKRKSKKDTALDV